MYKNLRRIFLIMSIFSTLFIFHNSMKPAESSSHDSGIIVAFLGNFLTIDIHLLTTIIRKLAHILEFFMQSFFIGMYLSFSYKYKKNIIYVLFMGLFTAVCDEFLQAFVPGRGSLVSDVFIDFTGTVTAVIVSCLLNFILSKRKKA